MMIGVWPAGTEIGSPDISGAPIDDPNTGTKSGTATFAAYPCPPPKTPEKREGLGKINRDSELGVGEGVVEVLAVKEVDPDTDDEKLSEPEVEAENDEDSDTD